MRLADMPVVTFDHVLLYQVEALKIEQQRDNLLNAAKLMLNKPHLLDINKLRELCDEIEASK